MRLPRTTGALSGILIIVLGLWGALIPFIGPYFHYAFGSYSKWHFTTNRLWLDILPGALAVIGGFMLLTASRRSSGIIGGWLAMAAGAWFAIGPMISLWWHAAGNPIGAPVGGHIRQCDVVHRPHPRQFRLAVRRGVIIIEKRVHRVLEFVRIKRQIAKMETGV